MTIPPVFRIHHEPCECPPGDCAHFVDDDANCINRRRGHVVTDLCAACQAFTWHEDGRCLRCIYLATSAGAKP